MLNENTFLEYEAIVEPVLASLPTVDAERVRKLLAGLRPESLSGDRLRFVIKNISESWPLLLTYICNAPSPCEFCDRWWQLFEQSQKGWLLSVLNGLLHRFDSVASADDADDLLQETLLKVFGTRYNPVKAPFRVWLYRIAHNCFFDHLRTIRKRPDVAELTPAIINHSHCAAFPQVSALASDLPVCIEKLSSAEQFRLWAEHCSDLSYEEIAIMVRKKPREVKIIIREHRKKKQNTTGDVQGNSVLEQLASGSEDLRLPSSSAINGLSDNFTLDTLSEAMAIMHASQPTAGLGDDQITPGFLEGNEVALLLGIDAPAASVLLKNATKNLCRLMREKNHPFHYMHPRDLITREVQQGAAKKMQIVVEALGRWEYGLDQPWMDFSRNKNDLGGVLVCDSTNLPPGSYMGNFTTIFSNEKRALTVVLKVKASDTFSEESTHA